MSLSAATFRVHRWLGWLIGVQVLIWVTGGVVFSLLPFQSWVKGGDTVKPPTVVLPAGWAERVAPTLQAAARLGQVSAVAAVATPQGPALRLTYIGGHEPVIVPADGSAWAPPDEAALRRFATGLYRGQAGADDAGTRGQGAAVGWASLRRPAAAATSGGRNSTTRSRPAST